MGEWVKATPHPLHEDFDLIFEKISPPPRVEFLGKIPTGQQLRA